MEDEPEVARVWLPHDNAPGLAMARTFGDFCLKDYGLISVPDITYRMLTPNDQFVIFAIDGIWDVMSNRQAVEVVALAPSRVTAARLLVETEVRAWRVKYPTSKVDDCAVICLFLHQEAGTTKRCSPAAASIYYYTEEDEAEHDGDDEMEEEEIAVNDDTPAFTSSSPSSHIRQSVAMQPSKLSYISKSSAIRGAELEEIIWNNCSSKVHSNVLPRIDVHNSPNETPYPGYFVDTDEASPPSMLGIQAVDLLGFSSMQRKGKEQAVVSPLRRSLPRVQFLSIEDTDYSHKWEFHGDEESWASFVVKKRFGGYFFGLGLLLVVAAWVKRIRRG